MDDMDVLRPEIVRIGKRCYRKYAIEKKNTEDYEDEIPTMSQFEGDQTYCDEVCDAFTNIEETENGYRVALPVPTEYFKHIIGKKGETKRRLEHETRTQIRIPGLGREGDIVITGSDRNGVLSAKTRVDLLVDTARQRQPFTHFLSFPIGGEGIRQKFTEFKENVLRFCDGDRGLDSTIFQTPLKLHLTLGTMALLNEAEVDKSRQLLSQCHQDLVEPILRGRALRAQIRGLEYMNDDPSEVDVVYAKVELHDQSDRLQMLADRLVDKFAGAGLMQKEYDRVKLHVTVMNTLMRRDPSGTAAPRPDRRAGGGGAFRERESFNATNVLKLYRDYDFGPYHFNTLHLSQRYSTGKDGYYTCASHLDLP